MAGATRLQIGSPAFEPDGPIPREHTGEGTDRSPPLVFGGVPESCQELALIVEDPDAPTPAPWVHWVLYRIAPGVRDVPAGLSKALRPREVPGAAQGRNDFGGLGWGGPMPPRGHGPHRYRFRLFALATPIALPDGATRGQVLSAIKGLVLSEATLCGTYERRAAR